MKFDVPIVLFAFRRKETVVKILDVIKKINPRKIYILSDGGRNNIEKNEVFECRRTIDKIVDEWGCEVVRRYLNSNCGVYENIGKGAQWVFEKEDEAIFLEDDNLPDITFFEYCKRLLKRYKDNEKVFWICGTNYLGEYSSECSYMFTQSLLPCGWASWSYKFLKFYDGNLNTIKGKSDIDMLKIHYHNKALYKQQAASIYREYKNKLEGRRFNSWDYQLIYSIKKNDLLGISPKYNLIKNIGVDQFSIHGGSNPNEIMNKRFCEIETKSILEDWKDAIDVHIDDFYEKQIDSIILYPLKRRVISGFIGIIKKVFGIYEFDSLSEELRKKKR